MTEVQFWSEDSRFGVRLNGTIVPDILRQCEESAPQETGGILLGRYSAAHDCALVQIVTGAPADSKTGRTWFERGIRGLQAKLDLLWRRNGGYYLGEWHFHPFGAPIPSSTDNKQLRKISNSRLYRCPEPLLIILGGDPAATWSLRCFLFLRGRKEPTHLPYLRDQTSRTAPNHSGLPPAYQPTDCATYVINERSKALAGDS